MTHTYKINGMTCEGCQSEVQNALSDIHGVQNVKVDLKNGIAVVDTSTHIPTQQLQNALKPYPKFQLSELDTSMHHTMQDQLSEDSRTWLEIYKPVLLVFGYLLTITLLIEFVNGFDWMGWMNNFMAGFFLTFSFFKLLNLKGFAESYYSYDIVARKWFGWGYVYPFVELGLGLAFLTTFEPVIINTITLVVMSISIIGVLKSVLNKRKIKCACLGTVFNLPMSTITIIEDALMILMSAIMLIKMI